ncbi:MAG: hypothetical protein ACKOXB_09275 [Flavobacteriales bacterium]
MIEEVSVLDVFLSEKEAELLQANSHILKLKMYETTNYIQGLTFGELENLLEGKEFFTDLRETESEDIYFSDANAYPSKSLRIRKYISSNSASDTVDIIVCDNDFTEELHSGFVGQDINVQYFTEVVNAQALYKLIVNKYTELGWKPTYSIRKKRKRWSMASESQNPSLNTGRAICVIDQILCVRKLSNGEEVLNPFESNVVLEFEVDEHSFHLYHPIFAIVEKLILDKGGILIPKLDRKITTLTEQHGG